MERHSTSTDLIAVQKRLAPFYIFLSKNRTDPAFGLVLALIFLGILIPQERHSKLHPKPGRRGTCYLGRHCFDHCKTGSLKRNNYAVERRASAKTNLLTRFTSSNLIYSSLAVGGGSLKETNGYSQWFLSRETQEKPTARRVNNPRTSVRLSAPCAQHNSGARNVTHNKRQTRILRHTVELSQLSICYAMPISPNKVETAVHGC